MTWAWPPCESVAVIRAGGLDVYGDPSETGDSAEQSGCVIYPSGSAVSPDMLGRTPVDAVLTVLGPHGWDVRGTDDVVVRGVRYSVTGMPFDWGPGVEVHLKTRAG